MSANSHHTSLTRALLRTLGDPAEIATKHSRPPVAHMLLAAQLAEALGSSDAARALATPMSLTVVIVPDPIHLGRLASALSFTLAGLSDVVDMDLMTHVSQIASDDLGGRDEARRREKFHEDIDIEVGLGKAIIAVVQDASELSPAALSLPSTSYRLPAINGMMISEVLRALDRGPSSRLSRLLSEADQQIAKVPFPLLVGAIRQTRPGATVETILQAVQRLAHKTKTGVLLDDLYLPDDVRKYAEGVMTDIQDWRAGQVEWSTVSTSALLYGPPGTGKTSIARALAYTADLHFVLASFSESQSAGPLSEYLRSMNTKVSEAIDNAPSIFFIDEMDTYCTRAQSNDNNESYMMLVVDHLLEVLSRLDQASGVVVIGATNHPSHIDPAVRRAGRLDTHLYIGNPDRLGIEKILRVKLGEAGRDLDLTETARTLVGLSGADVEVVARKALARARHERRDFAQADLLLASNLAVPAGFAQQMQRIALHEAGHTVVRAAVGLPLPKSAILSATGSHVASEALTAFRGVEIDQLMATLLGGRAAEMLILGDSSSGAETDIAQATSYALARESRLCLDVVVPLYAPYLTDNPETWPADLRSAILRRMSAAQKTAFHAIKANNAVLHAVTDALIAERELGADQIAALLAEVTPVPLVAPPTRLPVEKFIDPSRSVNPSLETAEEYSPSNPLDRNHNND